MRPKASPDRTQIQFPSEKRPYDKKRTQKQRAQPEISCIRVVNFASTEERTDNGIISPPQMRPSKAHYLLAGRVNDFVLSARHTQKKISHNSCWKLAVTCTPALTLIPCSPLASVFQWDDRFKCGALQRKGVSFSLEPPRHLRSNFLRQFGANGLNIARLLINKLLIFHFAPKHNEGTLNKGTADGRFLNKCEAIRRIIYLHEI